MATTYCFKAMLTENGWLSPAYVGVDQDGKITSIGSGKPAAPVRNLNAIAIPGFQNAHSHAFQYAMAGLAEIHETQKTPDDFWSWREAMYNLALQVSPDQLEAIAAMLYAEMVRHGYTHVAEFHYVHYDQQGQAYANLSEMGERLIAAADTAGIGITLVPIWYQQGGFGKAPSDGQRRFISPDRDVYLKLLEASSESCKNYSRANPAIGVHSLRAVEPEAVSSLSKMNPEKLPFHIHISEQLKEVEDALAYLGKRPVDWLLDNVELNERYHLVHATHLTENECDRLAGSGANVVICPTTEGNLGDGIFPLRRFQEKGGKWSIGTDSHVSLNPLEEFRLLDYGQRLISHKRNTFYSNSQGNSALFAIDMALKSGRKAMNNFSKDYFSVGQYLDAVLYHSDAPLLKNALPDHFATTIVYSIDSYYHYGTISGGKLLVENGRHIREEEIRSAFESSINSLGNR